MLERHQAAGRARGASPAHLAARRAAVATPHRRRARQDAAEKLLQVGPASELIAEAAAKGGHDLLMLGSHGHGALGNLVLGSVATKVLANCRTPALLIR